MLRRVRGEQEEGRDPGTLCRCKRKPTPKLKKNRKNLCKTLMNNTKWAYGLARKLHCGYDPPVSFMEKNDILACFEWSERKGRKGDGAMSKIGKYGCRCSKARVLDAFLPNWANSVMVRRFEPRLRSNAQRRSGTRRRQDFKATCIRTACDLEFCPASNRRHEGCSQHSFLFNGQGAEAGSGRGRLDSQNIIIWGKAFWQLGLLF